MSISLMPASGVTERVARQIAQLFADLVADGAALGWIDPPDDAEIGALLTELAPAVGSNDARAAIARTFTDDRAGRIVGFTYWTRYTRATHRPHVDLEKLAVARGAQGCGIGTTLMNALIASAHDLNVEVITLDLRGDNTSAIRLYQKLGFERYGILPDFVAVGDKRCDKHFYSLDLRR